MGDKPYWYQRCVAPEVANEYKVPPLRRALTEAEAMMMAEAALLMGDIMQVVHEFLKDHEKSEMLVDIGSVFIASYQSSRQLESLRDQHIKLGGVWPD